jgi:hypothetical protein
MTFRPGFMGHMRVYDDELIDINSFWTCASKHTVDCVQYSTHTQTNTRFYSVFCRSWRAARHGTRPCPGLRDAHRL